MYLKNPHNNMRMKIVTIILLLFISMNSIACTVPMLGYDWDKDQLIEQADTIVLAKATKKENGNIKTYSLEVVEVLRGKSTPIEISEFSEEHSGSTFNNHTATQFWEKGVGRSEFPCCVCGPIHTFIEGELYLVFPGAWGATKSAEIIKDKVQDKWYQYVKENSGAI